MPSCWLWLLPAWTSFHHCAVLSSSPNWCTLCFQSHNNQPWDPQWNKVYKPILLSCIFQSASEPTQPSPTWEKGVWTWDLAKAHVHHLKEDFWMPSIALAWHNSWRWQWDLHQPSPLPTTLRPIRRFLVWWLCTLLQSSAPQNPSPLLALISHVPFPGCSVF